MLQSSPVRWVLRLVVAALLFFLTLEVTARLVWAYPSMRRTLNSEGPEARKLISVQAAKILHGGGVIHIDAVDPDPELGWVLGRNVVHQIYALTTDANGQRPTRPPDRVLAPDAPRVALLGDSFTLGLEVADSDAWAWHLQEQTDAEIVNRAVHGYGLDQAVLSFERHAAGDHPQVVILGLNELLLLRTSLSWDAWAKPWFSLEGGRLVEHGLPVPSPQQVLAETSRSMAVAFWPVLWEHYTRPRGRPYDVDLVTAIFDRLRADVRAANAELVLVQMPVRTQAFAAGSSKQDLDVFHSWCANPDVHCVDLAPALVATAAAHKPLTAGAHWSAEVNAAVADLLAADLLGAGMVPARGSTAGEE